MKLRKSMKNNDEVNVYWAPLFHNNEDKDYNWNIIYPDPISVYENLRPNKSQTEPNNNFFYCPAFKGFTSNVFLFKNPIACDFIVDEKYNLISNTKNFVNASFEHHPSIEDCLLIFYGLRWIFFSEEELDITVTSPFFITPKHMQYANIVPGKFSISNWFRAVNTEFNLKPGIKNLKIEKDEPILSVFFNTNKKVNLVRFEMNDKLVTSSSVCGRSSDWEAWVPLLSRYKRFKETRMKEIILKEIKNNLVK